MNDRLLLKEFLGAYWRYLKSPKGRWDFFDYGGFLLVFLLFCFLVILGGYQLQLI
jgi:hypothetical protein